MIQLSPGSLWAYRGFVLESIHREFQSQYRRSLLGAAWALINPLAMILVYTVVFSRIMQTRLGDSANPYAYSTYLCAGIFLWGLFSQITARSCNMFLEHANLLKKMNFPWLTLPLIVASNACLNFAIVFGLFTAFMVLSGTFPGWVYLAMLPVLAILVALAMGLGIILGVLHVFFRDVGPLFTVVLQFWFWLTPIVYPPDILPRQVQWWLALNPLTHLVVAAQDILARGQLPQWSTLWPAAILALAVGAVGLHLFAARSGEMVDEL